MPILRLEVVEEVGQLFVLLFRGSIEGVEMIEFLIMVVAMWFLDAPGWAYVLLIAFAITRDK